MDIWTRFALFMSRLSPFGLDAAAIFEPLQGRIQ